jgi:hypothetical protein
MMSVVLTSHHSYNDTDDDGVGDQRREADITTRLIEWETLD